MQKDPTASQEILRVIRQLADRIGGRGACSAGLQRASRVLAAEMSAAGVGDVSKENFRASRSTYSPYILAFLLWIVSSVLIIVFPDDFVCLLCCQGYAAALHGLMAETNLSPNWMRLFLPRHTTNNLTAHISPCKKATRAVVLCAHMDTHRTPIFYSSPKWIKIFGLTFLLVYPCMFLSIIIALLTSFLSIAWMRWLLCPFQAPLLFAVALCVHADFTPYSPGANDDASGVAIVTALARRLVKEPLDRTAVTILLTDCEEAGCMGMRAFLRQHHAELDPGTLFIILDEVGAGTLTYLTSDGLVRKHPTHPMALRLIEKSSKALPEIELFAKAGAAYTDALVATKAGYPAITLVNTPAAGKPTRWHQMSDVPQFIEPETLEKCHTLVLQILRDFDRS